jgi:hypothetical protein
MIQFVLTLTVLVLIPSAIAGYEARALTHGGLRRLWRDGLAIALVMWLLSFPVPTVTFWHQSAHEVSWLDTPFIAYGAIAITAAIQLLRSPRIPTWVRRIVPALAGIFIIGLGWKLS